MPMKQLTAKNYDEIILLAVHPVIINLTAGLSKLSKITSKILDEVADEYGDYVDILEMSTDTQPELNEMLEVDSLPLMVMMDGGVVTKKLPGIPTKEEIIEVMELETIKEFQEKGINYHPKRNYIPANIRYENW